MKLVFLGTSEFACPALESLDQHHDVRLVITQPDRPAGRRQKLRPPPVKTVATSLGLSVTQPEQINSKEGIQLLQDANPDVIVVAAYGQILTEQVFDVPDDGTINIHASLLPRYRGAAPINWAIIRGERETGITTFVIDEGMDTGDILVKRSILIGEDETAGQLHDRLAVLGAEVILETLEGVRSGTISLSCQDSTNATYAPMLSRRDGRIDWTDKAQSIHNTVRGMNPWPSAFTTLNGKRMKVLHTRIPHASKGSITPGEVALPDSGRLLVGARDELLEILEIQPESRTSMTGGDFLNGIRGQARFD